MKDKKFIIKPPREKILRTDYLAMALNPARLSARGLRIVDLACGHVSLTRSHGTTVCPRCTEMLRRSVADGSEDWYRYRHSNLRYTMVWRDDPCRQFNERMDSGDIYPD